MGLCRTETGRQATVLLTATLVWGTQLHPLSELSTRVPFEWDATAWSTSVLAWWYLVPAVVVWAALHYLDRAALTDSTPSAAGGGDAESSATLESSNPQRSSKKKTLERTSRAERDAIRANGLGASNGQAGSPQRRVKAIPAFVSEWSDAELTERFIHMDVKYGERVVGNNREYYNSVYVQLLAEKVERT